MPAPPPATLPSVVVHPGSGSPAAPCRAAREPDTPQRGSARCTAASARDGSQPRIPAPRPPSSSTGRRRPPGASRNRRLAASLPRSARERYSRTQPAPRAAICAQRSGSGPSGFAGERFWDPRESVATWKEFCRRKIVDGSHLLYRPISSRHQHRPIFGRPLLTGMRKPCPEVH